jgi:nucleotide-binding universal stress UspA family protein
VKRIVVGVDDSPGSEAALTWAAEEARLHDAELLIVHAYGVPSDYPSLTLAAVYTADTRAVQRSVSQRDRERQAGFDRARQHAEATVATALRRALPHGTGIHLESLPVANTRPARALIEASRDADLLVVGSRGRGNVAGLVLGSVSQQCLHHSACPVAVVRPAA